MEPTDTGTEEVQAPSKVVINGQEYDSTEASELIGIGQRAREYETKANTKLESIYPEYTRLTQERSQWNAEKQKLEAELQKFQTKKEEGTETEVDIQKAQEAARKLGLTLKDDLTKEGYVRRDDIEKILEERESVQKILQSADALEKEIDGSDGRPKFNKKAVLAYASTYRIDDLKRAYDDMYADVLKDWQQKQVDSQKPDSLKTLKSTGKKQPAPVKVDDSNFDQMLKEAMGNKD